nr:hypothetical protein [Sicyoidochytrium minutum DNA virus]
MGFETQWVIEGPIPEDEDDLIDRFMTEFMGWDDGTGVWVPVEHAIRNARHTVTIGDVIRIIGQVLPLDIGGLIMEFASPILGFIYDDKYGEDTLSSYVIRGEITNRVPYCFSPNKALGLRLIEHHAHWTEKVKLTRNKVLLLRIGVFHDSVSAMTLVDGLELGKPCLTPDLNECNMITEDETGQERCSRCSGSPAENAVVLLSHFRDSKGFFIRRTTDDLWFEFFQRPMTNQIVHALFGDDLEYMRLLYDGINRARELSDGDILKRLEEAKGYKWFKCCFKPLSQG